MADRDFKGFGHFEEAFKGMVHEIKSHEDPAYDGANPKNPDQVMSDLKKRGIVNESSKKVQATSKPETEKKVGVTEAEADQILNTYFDITKNETAPKRAKRLNQTSRYLKLGASHRRSKMEPVMKKMLMEGTMSREELLGVEEKLADENTGSEVTPAESEMDKAAVEALKESIAKPEKQILPEKVRYSNDIGRFRNIYDKYMENLRSTKDSSGTTPRPISRQVFEHAKAVLLAYYQEKIERMKKEQGSTESKYNSEWQRYQDILEMVANELPKSRNWNKIRAKNMEQSIANRHAQPKATPQPSKVETVRNNRSVEVTPEQKFAQVQESFKAMTAQINTAIEAGANKKTLNALITRFHPETMFKVLGEVEGHPGYKQLLDEMTKWVEKFEAHITGLTKQEESKEPKRLTRAEIKNESVELTETERIREFTEFAGNHYDETAREVFASKGYSERDVALIMGTDKYREARQKFVEVNLDKYTKGDY